MKIKVHVQNTYTHKNNTKSNKRQLGINTIIVRIESNMIQLFSYHINELEQA